MDFIVVLQTGHMNVSADENVELGEAGASLARYEMDDPRRRIRWCGGVVVIWGRFANDDIIPHKFSVGDLGYLPKGANLDEKNWKEFAVLCNVFEQGRVKLETKDVVEGKQGGWQHGVRAWEDLPSYELPGGLFG